MCGLLGIVGAVARLETGAFDRALQSLLHRGPDDHGVFEGSHAILGARRLSIIDLSSSGHQPMADPQSGCVIVFNGEIYNHVELRRDLAARGHRFTSRTDTEVLLKAYVEWGSDCLSRFNGMWAFAIWDPRRNMVFLSRDRFGVKPLYYLERTGLVAFASEPKALLSLFPESRTVNKRALYRFLAMDDLYSQQESFYDEIRLLPPAHFAEVKGPDPCIKARRYWHLEAIASGHRSERSALGEFVELFEDAVKVRLRSDVPIGLSLSGGLDSSSILHRAAIDSGQGLTCLTAVYQDGERDELDWATRAAHPYSARVVPVISTREAWLPTLATISRHMDAPGHSPAVYPMWNIMRAARDHGIRVILEGQGADEAFGGYPRHAAAVLTQHLRRARLNSFATEYARLQKIFPARMLIYTIMLELFPRAASVYRRKFGARTLLREESFGPAPNAAKEIESSKDATPLTRSLYRDFTSSILPGLLHYSDAVGMGQSVECRAPFMDYRLVEWIFAADDACKIDKGETKRILRDYLRKVGLVAIADRKDKQGYPTPVVRWLSGDDGALARDILLQPQSLIGEYCHTGSIARMIDRHARNPGSTDLHLYKLVSTELWLRTCIAGPVRQDSAAASS